MKKRNRQVFPVSQDVVFMPALAPLEASVIPAGERRSFGALRHAKEAFRLPGEPALNVRGVRGVRGAAGARLSGRRSGSGR